MNNVLQNKFSEKEFTEYVSSYLPDFQATDSRVEARRGFSGVKQIGESPKLDLVVFEVTPEASIHARMEISKQSYALLKTHPRAHAIIAYHSDDHDEWRLSLITTQVTRDKKGVKETVSNPRRFSYVLGPKAKVNTPTKYLVSKGNIIDLNDLKERFSLEVVNKDFYREISNLFVKLTGGIHSNGKNKKEYEAMLQLPSVPTGDQRNLEFAVRLIGRVIFCWFLREKKSSAGIALMPKELLSHNAIDKNPDYYHSILEPIFFEVLNKHVKSRKDRYAEQPFSSIPYLNGGLFSPEYDDYFSYNEGKQATYHNTVVVPDEWIKEFFAFLETFNFTIDENVSFDEELSIDPEMLGRIFENLLAEINPETGESARKNTGSYYTPRTIVDYMVDEGLFTYLKEKTSIDEQKLRAVITYDLEDNTQYPLSAKEFDKVTDALSKIKILDPACGSGAFPIGALQKIVFILQQVDPDGHRWFEKQVANTAPEIKRIIEREFANKNFNYIRKLGVIRENIFGVDIQPIATEISRLRCFLTLVVDQSIHEELENRGVEPLPNLDFKFVTANTLIQLPGAKTDTLFKDQERISQLKELRSQFFSSTNSERQRLQLEFKELQNQMLDRMIETKGADEITRTLSTWNPFSHKMTPWFDPEWMFGVERFDVVIGNPPYGAKINKEMVETLKPRFKNSIKGKVESYRIFMEDASLLCEKEGVVALIVPNTWMYIEQALPLRKYLLKNTSIKVLASMPQTVFTATVDSIVIVWANSYNEANKALTFSIPLKDNVSDVSAYLTNGKYVNQSDWLDSDKYIFTVGEDRSVYDLIAKIKKNNDSFSKYIYTKQGLIPYLTKEDGRENKYISKEKLGDDWYPYFDGSRCIDRYTTKGKISYIKYGDWLYAPREKELFDRPRIIFQLIRNISLKRRIVATYLDTKVYSDRNTGLIFTKPDTQVNLKYILGLLNSNLINFIHSKSHNSTYISFPSIESLPFALGNEEDQARVVSLVEKVMVRKQKAESTEELENELNELIMDIYQLTDEEKTLVKKAEI